MVLFFQYAILKSPLINHSHLNEAQRNSPRIIDSIYCEVHDNIILNSEQLIVFFYLIHIEICH